MKFQRYLDGENMYKIENLSFKYEKNKFALKNINMDFSKGDIIGVIGDNGC